jgi:alkane 1-monooxygenase
MVPLRYLTPFGFLVLPVVGGLLGGAWTFTAAAAVPICLASLDTALGNEAGPERSGSNRAMRWLPRLYIVLQLAATAWAARLAVQPETRLLEAAGLALSAGVTTGVFGFVAAHEMIHSRDRRERALGLALLGSVFYMHFRIAHVYGHHRRAATFEDPASARLGEGLYAFLLRSISGQFREAWVIEAKRRGHGRFGNRMIAYLTFETAFLIAVALVSGRAFLFLIAVAMVAIALLESFNYVAHYGLSRHSKSDGRAERLTARHSWNTAKRMNNAALFNMGCHSDHHRRAAQPYEQLEPVGGSAELPYGYAGAMLLALIPQLWRKVMDPRAEAAMAGSARTPATINSGAC